MGSMPLLLGSIVYSVVSLQVPFDLQFLVKPCYPERVKQLLTVYL